MVSHRVVQAEDNTANVFSICLVEALPTFMVSHRVAQAEDNTANVFSICMVEAPPVFVVIAVMTEIDASRSVVVGKISDITDKNRTMA